MKVTLHHKVSKHRQQIKVGFSWTTLFFGGWVPLYRGDMKHTIIYFIMLVITAGFSWLVYPFIYNKLYIRGLFDKGYEPANDTDRTVLAARGIMR